MKVKNLLDDNENKPEPQTLPVEVFAPWANIVIRFKASGLFSASSFRDFLFFRPKPKS